MKRLWKTIASVLPGPAVLWAGKWLDLFSRTHLTYPEWQVDAQNIALGIGALTAIIICLTLNDADRQLLKKLTWLGFIVTVTFLCICWAIWFYLGKPMPAAGVLVWHDVWEGAYIIAMVSMVATLSVGALSLREETTKTVWIVFGVAALVIVLFLGVIFWLLKTGQHEPDQRSKKLSELSRTIPIAILLPKIMMGIHEDLRTHREAERGSRLNIGTCRFL